MDRRGRTDGERVPRKVGLGAPIGMDIEDAVERHDIGWMNRFSKLEEVAVLLGDPAGEASAVLSSRAVRI